MFRAIVERVILLPKLRTQKDVAKLIGVSQGEVCKRERNAIRKLNKAFARFNMTVAVTADGMEVRDV